MLLRPQPAGAEHTQRPRCDAISEFGPFHQVVLREAMERAGQLFRMDAEPAPKALKRNSRGGGLGQELQDFAVVLSQVERLGLDSRAATFWHHRRPLTTSATDKSASARIEGGENKDHSSGETPCQARKRPF